MIIMIIIIIIVIIKSILLLIIIIIIVVVVIVIIIILLLLLLLLLSFLFLSHQYYYLNRCVAIMFLCLSATTTQCLCLREQRKEYEEKWLQKKLLMIRFTVPNIYNWPRMN